MDSFMKAQFDADKRETTRQKRKQFFSNLGSSINSGIKTAKTKYSDYSKKAHDFNVGVKKSSVYKAGKKFVKNYNRNEERRERKNNNSGIGFSNFGSSGGIGMNPLGNTSKTKKNEFNFRF
jgi:hypothetical protein